VNGGQCWTQVFEPMKVNTSSTRSHEAYLITGDSRVSIVLAEGSPSVPGAKLALFSRSGCRRARRMRFATATIRGERIRRAADGGAAPR
jgi:hypothetical protein